MTPIAFFDTEVSPTTKQLVDIGCARSDDAIFHQNHPIEFQKFVEKTAFIIGHNILSYDLIYIQKHFGNPAWGLDKAIDTLLLSPLLFPKNPYHRLLKDDKLQTDELNNPVNDSLKARNLFFDEVNAFENLDGEFKEILYLLLSDQIGFRNFIKYIAYKSYTSKFSKYRLLQKHLYEIFSISNLYPCISSDNFFSNRSGKGIKISSPNNYIRLHLSWR